MRQHRELMQVMQTMASNRSSRGSSRSSRSRVSAWVNSVHDHNNQQPDSHAVPDKGMTLTPPAGMRQVNEHDNLKSDQQQTTPSSDTVFEPEEIKLLRSQLGNMCEAVQKLRNTSATFIQELQYVIPRVKTENEFKWLMHVVRTRPRPINFRQKSPPLPKLMNGDNWRGFLENLIESTAEYYVSDLDNMARLRDSLGPKPMAIVGHWLDSSSIYFVEALAALRMSYGNVDHMLAALEKEAESTPDVDEQGRNLQLLAMRTKKVLCSLRACGLPDNTASHSLLTRLTGKLPLIMTFRWGDYRQRENKSMTLSAFSEYLQSELTTALDGGQSRVRIGNERKVNYMNQLPEEMRGQDGAPRTAHPPVNSISVDAASRMATTTAANVSTSEQINPISCVLCPNQVHRLGDCIKFKAASDDARMQLVDQHKLCWKCLRPYHGRCFPAKKCGVDQCEIRHHPMLHKCLIAKLGPRPMVSTITRGTDGVLFKILPVQLQWGEMVKEVYAFVDEGSNVSLINQQLALDLGATGPKNSLTIKWANENYKTDPNSMKLALTINGLDGPSTLKGIHTMEDLDIPEQTLHPEVIDQLFPNGGGPAPYFRVKPQLLLGLNHAHLCSPRELKESNETDYIGIKTKLGWVIYGGNDDDDSFVGLNYRVCHASLQDDKLEAQMKSFFDIESFGVRAAPKLLGKKEARAMDILQSTTRKVGDRYEAGLLWAEDSPQLPDSKEMCTSRAKSLCARLKNDPELSRKLEALLDDYKKKGYCREIAALPAYGPTWYLPVFPVVNEKKPEKVRLVWDAAATVEGRSLNSFLLSGPDLLSPLHEVFMRFRERKVAVTADVCEMFHRVYIRKEDRDAQRFLWMSPTTNAMTELRLDVMSFGATCSPTTAQFIQRSNALLYHDEYPVAVNEILRGYYVDDQLSSFDDVETARRVMTEVITIQKNAGFELSKWRSSHPEALPSQTTVDTSEKTIAAQDGSVLGMVWNSEKDTLRFAVGNSLEWKEGDKLTRRKMSSGAMSFYDPMGQAANVIIKAKLMLKNCLGRAWDEKLPESMHDRWKWWCGLVAATQKLTIPRFHNIAPYADWELHTFVDASEEAYAACVYARGMSASGQIVCSLVMAKTRVAPVRATTIPRMELLAAVLGSRLVTTVTKATSMKIGRRILWSDSLDVLCWVRSSHRRYAAFVGARIDEILNETAEEEWRWVNTNSNVADDATRMSSPHDNPRWYRGPEFLYLDESQWPVLQQKLGPPKEELLPMLTIERKCLGLIPDIERFSKWCRLRNATAYAIRFMLGEIKKSEHVQLNGDEILRAKEELFRAAQIAEYDDLAKKLTEDPKRQLPKRHRLYKLCPIADDKGILRVNGRLPRALFPMSVRQPIILPSDNRIVRLLVEYQHEKYLHGNHETVVNEIRKEFYIPGLRRLLRDITRKCLHCQIRNPIVEEPQMGPLIEGRAAIGWKAFTYCGVDYFGPFEVVIGRRREKRWVALYTCLTTRAVHLVLVHSLDMESCVMSLRILMAVRDVKPKEIRSDCGTNFTASAKELERFKDHFPGTKWVFNPPGAPHQGGVWERMVRTVKRCLTQVIGDRALTDEVLRCALAEAEWVVNSHPLTHVSLDADDEPALTPHDFLNGAAQQRDINETVLNLSDEKFLKKSWRNTQQIADHFWKRFAREVIPVLNMRTKWFQRAEPLAVGDVVMIADETVRGKWRRGRIIEVIKGKSDDQVRQVRMNTARGELVRPVVKVAKVDAVAKD